MALAEQITQPATSDPITAELTNKFGADHFLEQHCVDRIPTFWVERQTLCEVMAFLKQSSYAMLFDITAIDM